MDSSRDRTVTLQILLGGRGGSHSCHSRTGANWTLPRLLLRLLYKVRLQLDFCGKCILTSMPISGFFTDKSSSFRHELVVRIRRCH
jgi:hypothetical protein